MNFSVGDGIAIAAFLWFVAWMLAKLFPMVFGGSVEDYVMLHKVELERKWAAFAKAKNDEAERRRAAKAAREAADTVPFRTRFSEQEPDVLTKPQRPRSDKEPF